jgi:hypothetical protein
VVVVAVGLAALVAGLAGNAVSAPGDCPAARGSARERVLPMTTEETVWVVENQKGRSVKIIKRGRRWLYLEPLWGWDVPRVDCEIEDGKKCVVQGWGGAVAWATKAHCDECALRDRIWTAIHNFVECKYSPPEDILTPELQEAARLLMVQVD